MNDCFKILIAEDSDSDYELLSRYLAKNHGVEFSPSRVETREEFERALKESWDAILSDYNIPGFGALAALEILKLQKIDIPLIVLSGEVGEERAVEIMHAGAEDFVRKENLSRLVPALERSIHMGRMRQRKAKLRIAHEQTLKDRERIMDVVCHDIKNPLSSIRIASQLLIEKSTSENSIDKKVVIEIAEAILRSSDRVNRLIRDILDQSRIESGILGISSKKVSLTPFMKEVMDAFQPIAKNDGLTLTAQLEEELVEAHFDRDRVFQVIGNLISNAIKFSSPKGTVTVTGRSTERGIHFSVADSGPGIAQEEQNLIFSKFFQGTKNKVKGHGLGLWIAQEIIRAHGGQIGFHPNVDRPGTTFWFSLPTLLNKIEEPSQIVSSRAGSRVLIVDDDEDLTLFICRVLTDRKVPCMISDGFDSAIEIFKKEQLNKNDVLLVDYDLPKKNGGELIEWLRKQIPLDSLPKIVLMSAHPDIDVRAKSLGLKHYLRKPMNIDEIFQIVTTGDGLEEGAS